MSDETKKPHEKIPADHNKWLTGKLPILLSIVAIAISVIPYAKDTVSYFTRTRVTISWPRNRSKNILRSTYASGIAAHVPASSDLWLAVRSGIQGKWYPVEFLNIGSDGSWEAPSHYMCPGVGMQDIEVWLVPDVDDGELVSYVDGKGRSINNPSGISSMPPGATLEAFSNIQVKQSKC